jgi:DNA-binding protein HU-beta
MTKKPTKRTTPVAVPEPTPEVSVDSGKLTKAQLIEQVGTQAKLTKAQTTSVVNALLEAVVAALTQGQTVSLSDVGTFSVTATAARTGRNPGTGEAIDIPAGKKVTFKVAKTLKSSL